MSEDRIQRQIEFIVEQQAKFTVDIAELRQGLAEMKETQERASAETREHITKVVDAILSLTNIVEGHENRLARNEAEIAALIEHGKETDARLNALINIVESHITSTKAHEGGE